MQARQGTQGVPSKASRGGHTHTGGSESVVQPCLSTHRPENTRVQQQQQTKHDKPTPFLLQTPMSPSPEPQTASTPVPHRLPSTAPASLQLPIGNADTSSASLPQAGQRSFTLPHHCLQKLQQPLGEGQKNWVQCCSPLPESEGGEAQSHLALSPSCSLAPGVPAPPKDRDTQRSRAQSGAALAAAQMPRNSFAGHRERCRKALLFFKPREGTSSPNSSSLSFPLSRTTSSPFSTKASKIAYK